MKKYDLVVVGGGAAGIGAAIEAKKQGIESILVLEREKELGGILQQCIHNGFGIQIFKEELTGPEYAQRYIDELEEMNIEYKLSTSVMDIKDKMVSYINSEEGFVTVQAIAIILAMGSRERTRGSINIPGDRPVGVYSAGLAQELINKDGLQVGTKAIILGTGDIGLIMARRLALEGCEVVGVLARGSYAAGLNRNIVQCLEDYDIPLMLNKNIIQINGDDRVESVVIVDTDENKRPIPNTEELVEVDLVLFSIGLIPENDLSLDAGISLDEKTGGAIVDDSMQTDMEGVFACGNVLHIHDIVDYVTREAEKAARSAAKYIKGQEAKSDEFVDIKAGKGISYVVPQKIRTNTKEKTTEIYYRVDQPYENIEINVYNGDEIIRTSKKRAIVPSEMSKAIVINDKLDSCDITIGINEGD